MKIAVSSDEYTTLIDILLEELQEMGHVVSYEGPTATTLLQNSNSFISMDWPEVTQRAVEKIYRGDADEAIVLCWTGTGCVMAANKIPGIRAALCIDAMTAQGARKWNHANVLGLSLRLTSPPMLKEILQAWMHTPWSHDDWNLLQIERIRLLDSKRVNA